MMNLEMLLTMEMKMRFQIMKKLRVTLKIVAKFTMLLPTLY